MKILLQHAWICILLMAISCTPTLETPEYKALILERDSLYLAVKESDAHIEDVTNTINDIEVNLASVDAEKDVLLGIRKEDQVKQKDRINAMVADIYVTLEKNQISIKKLEDRLAQSNVQRQSLANLVKTLKKSIYEKELEVEKLRNSIVGLESKIDTLQAVVNAKERLLSEQKRLMEEEAEEAHFAYFIQGNRQELVAAKIIKKEGGFLGIGSVKVLESKLSKNRFLKIDTRKSLEVELGYVKKKELISTHPKDSYFFLAKDGGKIYLKISYPDKFWSISKFLVVETD
jgi:chromosome segregation ATPase